jgi:nitronate monooxygenase
MIWQNRLTQLLDIQYPIIQAPMLGVTSPEMVAAISNIGGLGSLPVGGLSPEKTLEQIKKTKLLTDRPFAVNLFAHDLPQINVSIASVMANYLERLGTDHDLQFDMPAIEALKFHSYREQIQILLDEKISIVSFTFGVLTDDVIAAFKALGVFLIGTATCVKEAVLLEQMGVDAITAQGIEAGGHRGTFLTAANHAIPQIGSMSLIPQIVDHVSVPVIASGGISDGRALKAALILGAQAVQIGTAFVASQESLAIQAYKESLQNAQDTDSLLTQSFSGRWARGLSNQFISSVEMEVAQTGLCIPEYPIQNSLTAALRAASQKQNNSQFTSLWAGQSACYAQQKSCATILSDLIFHAAQL